MKSVQRMLPVGAIILFWIILFVPGLGLKELWNPIEPRYAAIAKEMYLTKQFFVPSYLGEIYLEKPPLFFWLINLSFFLTGEISAWSAGLPSLLSSLGSLILIYLIGSSLFSKNGALVATALSLFNIRFAYQSNRIQMEIVLLFFMLLAIYGFIKWLKTKKISWLIVLYSSLGFSLLTKGLVGVVPILITILIYAFISKEFKLKELKLFSGFLIVMIILASWLVPAFLSQFKSNDAVTLFQNGFTRFFTERSKHGFAYYFIVLFYEFAPWTLFALPALWYKGRAAIKEVDRVSQFLILWLIVTILFFSLNSKRHSHYIITMVPVVALLVGYWFQDNKYSKITYNLIRFIAISLLAVVPLLLATFLIFPHVFNGSKYNWILPHILQLPIPTQLTIMGIGALLCTIGAFRKKINYKLIYSGILIYFGSLILFVNLPLMKILSPIKSSAQVRSELAKNPVWQNAPIGTFGSINRSESMLGWFYFYTGKSFNRLNNDTKESKKWLENSNNLLLIYSEDIDWVRENVSGLKIESTLTLSENKRLLLVRKPE